MPTRDITTFQPAHPHLPPLSVSPGWDGGGWASPNVVISLAGIRRVGRCEMCRGESCRFPHPGQAQGPRIQPTPLLVPTTYRMIVFDANLRCMLFRPYLTQLGERAMGMERGNGQ